MTTPAPLWLAGAGLTCAVGRTALPAAAAIDAGVVRFRTLTETVSSWSLHPVAVVPELSGAIDARVRTLLDHAVSECRLEVRDQFFDHVAVYAGWAGDHPGAARCPSRVELAAHLGRILDLELDPEEVHVLRGETAGLRALAAASVRLRQDPDVGRCLVCAADSWMDVGALRWLGERRHRMTPGEAGVALWLAREPAGPLAAQLLGVGVSWESTSIPGPFTIALVRAVEHALEEASLTFDALDLRVSDIGTLPSDYAEHTLAAAHLCVRPREGYRTLEPARQIGTTGAAAGLVNVVVAAYLLARRGRVQALCTASSDGAARVAVVLAAPPRANGLAKEGEPPWAM